jgi:DNA-binding LacI/PurR family transcriptional regulator
MAKIDDIVRVSGISRSTVFRFLNGSQIRPTARDAIQKAMLELNYFFDPRGSRADVVVVISTQEHFEGVNVYLNIVSGIMNRATGLGLAVKLHSGSSLFLPEVERAITDKKRVGVIFVGKRDRDEESESALLLSSAVPNVFVNRTFEDPSRSFVSVDLRRAAREAVEYLLSLGYRDIGTWGCPADFRIDREKMAGFREAFAARSLPLPEACFSQDADGELEDVARRLLDGGRFPRSWFGLSDTHLMRLGAVLRDRGLRVPEDVALVGMDDQEASKYFSPPLTTVRIPFRQMGMLAVDLLIGLIENPMEVSARMYLKHELVVRESCGARMAIHGYD